MKNTLIKSIVINTGNLHFIADNHVINGTLLLEINRVMDEYAKQKLIEYQSYLFEKGLLKNKELKNDMVSEWLASNN